MIPTAVLGGAMIAMFGMVLANGIKLLSKVDYTEQANLLIIACSIGMGLGVTTVPELFGQLPASISILTQNGIIAGSLTAIILNVLFNAKTNREKFFCSIKGISCFIIKCKGSLFCGIALHFIIRS